MGRYDPGESQAADFDGTPIVQTNGPRTVDFQPLGDESTIGFGYDEFQGWGSIKDGTQRFSVEMIGVIVGAGDDIGKGQARGLDDERRHPDVRLVGLTIFFA